MKNDAPTLKQGSAGIAIDLLRGLLAVMVLLAHALESGLLMAKGTALPPWMAVTLGHGGFWVNGFFILSGFCIHRAILTQRQRGGSLVGIYTWARVTRLYPVYLVALMLALVISPWPGGGSLGSHLMMMQGVTGPLPAIKPAWSLTYEVVYYVAWPLCLAVCGWGARRAFIMAGAGTLMVAAVLMLVWKKGMGGMEGTWVLPMALIAAQFPLWLAGAWLAERWESCAPAFGPHASAVQVGASKSSFRGEGRGEGQMLASNREDCSPHLASPRNDTSPTFHLLSGERDLKGWLAPAGLVWILGGYLLQAWMLHRGASTSVMIVLGWLVVPGWLAVVLGSTCWRSLSAWGRPARWLGLLSYPLYLLHQPLLDMLVAAGKSYHLHLSLIESVTLLLAWVMGCMIVAGVPLEAATLKWRAGWLRRKEGRELKTVAA